MLHYMPRQRDEGIRTDSSAMKICAYVKGAGRHCHEHVNDQIISHRRRSTQFLSAESKSQAKKKKYNNKKQNMRISYKRANESKSRLC